MDADRIPKTQAPLKVSGVRSVRAIASAIARAAGGKWKRMERPDGIIRERRRLFPPSILFQQVHAPVAVDIPDAQTVGELSPIALGCNRMEFPRLGWIAPIRRSVAETAAGNANQFRFAVAIDVQEGGRFIVHRFRDQM